MMRWLRWFADIQEGEKQFLGKLSGVCVEAQCRPHTSLDFRPIVDVPFVKGMASCAGSSPRQGQIHQAPSLPQVL